MVHLEPGSSLETFVPQHGLSGLEWGAQVPSWVEWNAFLQEGWLNSETSWEPCTSWGWDGERAWGWRKGWLLLSRWCWLVCAGPGDQFVTLVLLQAGDTC